MNLMWILNEILFPFVEGSLVFFIFAYLIGNKRYVVENRLKSILFILLFAVFDYFSTTYTPPGFNTLFHFIFIVLLLSYLTRTNIYLSAIFCVLIGILISISETVVIFAIMLCFNMDISTLVTSPFSKLLALIFSKLLLIVLTIYIYKSGMRSPQLKFFNKKISSTYLLLQVFIMTMFITCISYISASNKNIIHFEMFIIVLYLFTLILGSLEYIDRSKQMKLQYKLLSQAEKVSSLEEVIDVMHRERHDFSNHLNTILAICKLNKPDAVKKIETYITKLTSNQISTQNMYNTGNDYINGLLSIKSTYAFQHNIEIDVDFGAPLNYAEVDDNDLVSIISNIVDNAIEAMNSMVSQSEKYVYILSYLSEDSYMLRIANNGPVIPSNTLHKIFESGYSTKENSNKEHGFGLHIVKHLVQKNEGQISVSSTEEGTEFVIKFKLRQAA